MINLPAITIDDSMPPAPRSSLSRVRRRVGDRGFGNRRERPFRHILWQSLLSSFVFSPEFQAICGYDDANDAIADANGMWASQIILLSSSVWMMS